MLLGWSSAEYMAIKNTLIWAWTEWPDAALCANQSFYKYREELADKFDLPSYNSILLLPTMVGLESYANDHHIEIVGICQFMQLRRFKRHVANPHLQNRWNAEKQLHCRCPPDEFFSNWSTFLGEPNLWLGANGQRWLPMVDWTLAWKLQDYLSSIDRHSSCLEHGENLKFEPLKLPHLVNGSNGHKLWQQWRKNSVIWTSSQRPGLL